MSKGISRRKFLKFAGGAGVAAVGTMGVPWKFGVQDASADAWSPLLPKWVGPLRGLRIDGFITGSEFTAAAAALPPGTVRWLADDKGIPVLDFPMKNPDPAFDAKSLPYGVADLLAGTKETMIGSSMYEIEAAEFVDYLHPAWEPNPATGFAGNPTRLWGYYDAKNPVKRHLAGVVVAVRGFSNRLRFTNKLTADGTATGAPLMQLLPNDKFTIPGAAQGDNRLAVHHHGGWMPWLADGGPFNWWKPDGTGGTSFMNGPGSVLDNILDPATGLPNMKPGQADYFYPNLSSSRFMWYHDHAFGITRLNAYAGLATGYLLLDPLQEAVMNTTLERVAAFTHLLDPVFKRLLGMPVDNTPLDDVTRAVVVSTVTNAAPKVPSIVSTIPIVLQEKKFVDGTPGTGTLAADPTWATVARPDVQSTGSMWYEHIYDPAKYRLLKGARYLTPPNPSCIPEFFGDTILVNGTIAPFAELEPKPYRFLFLNATQARAFNINLLQVAAGQEVTTPVDPAGNPLPPTNVPGPAMWIIGTEGGYLNKEVACNNQGWADPINLKGNVLFLPGERVDVVVDFTGCTGNEYVMYNDAQVPFPAGPPINDYFVGNQQLNPAMTGIPAGTTRDTRNVLKIKINQPLSVPEPSPAVGMIPATLPRVWDYFEASYAGYNPIGNANGRPTPIPAPASATVIRNLTLNENFDEWGRLRQLVGTTTIKPGTGGFGRLYLDPITEAVTVGFDGTKPVNQQSLQTVEIWNIFNTTADSHPMHFHMSNAQILKRQPFRIIAGRFVPTGVARGPEPDECGWKETCKMHPGEVITVCIKWELPPVPFGAAGVPSSPRLANLGQPDINETVWHCHILEHEEHDMMRPIKITGKNPSW
jgi:spore coat protein A, manganese oxidase